MPQRSLKKLNGEVTLKISVKRELCVGAGQCVVAADSIFDQDDDGIVVLLQDSVDADRLESARQAASLCPARAIEITD